VPAPDYRDDTTPAGSDVRQARQALISANDLGNGWNDVANLVLPGALGAAWVAGTEPASCQNDGRSGDVPGTGGSLQQGPGGDFVGTAVAQYDGVAGAADTYDDAMSTQEATCLAGLLQSGIAAAGGQATTKVSDLDRADRGNESDGFRVQVDATGADGRSWSGYVDLLGIRKGDQFALQMFGSVGDAPTTAVERRAQSVLAGQMGKS
jgi:hypothetical protein